MGAQRFAVAADADSQVRAKLAASQEGLKDDRLLQTARCPEVVPGRDVDEPRQSFRTAFCRAWPKDAADPTE